MSIDESRASLESSACVRDDLTSLYPTGLIEWAGHRRGGLRKPFRTDSGRPNGNLIATPLTMRLQNWVDSLVAGEASVPRTLLLVGGPGNGKTDAVETCVHYLDSTIGAGGNIVLAFADRFDVADGQLPPRKVIVDLAEVGISLPSHLQFSITLVQDATEGDPLSGRSAEELLLEELSERLSSQKDGVYLCCVNRGVLAHAATIAQEHSPDADAAELLDTITSAVTSDPRSPCPWPLAGFEHFAVWPMDVESLVDPSVAKDGSTVAHQILEAAIEESRWVTPCAAGPRCPFCQNRKLLRKRGALDSLVRLLRYYELASGKRWTFRDLFSLVPYLLVGDYTELTIKGKRVSPCDWAAAQIDLAASTRPGDTDKARTRAPYLLMSRLYHHRLFPRWPDMNRGKHLGAKRMLSDPGFVQGVDRARGFFDYLVFASRHPAGAGGEIAERVHGSLSELLDPALASGNIVLFSRGDRTYTVDEVEEMFSLSVREGFGLVESQLEPLERDLLRMLADADDALVEDNFPRTKAHNAKLLQSSLRQFCARLVKRSIGVRMGVCNDLNCFRDYEKALRDPHEQSDVRKHLRMLLHDGRRFRASLVTTFGQPLAQRSREVALLTQAVPVREFLPRVTSGRPPESMPYIQIDKSIIPLTFPLFKALSEVVEGLHDASLPAEIFALLNGIKSFVSGHIARDTISLIDNDARIEFGNSSLAVEILQTGFHVREVDD